MSTLITILHVTVCLFLMLTVLIQEGKSGMGGAFGGSSSGTVFGGAGASSFLRRLTAVAAAVFMLTSIILAYMASRDAGEPLARYSKTEAARLRQKKEAEKKGLQSALDGGVAPGANDGGVAPLGIDLGGASTPATPGTGATTGSSASGASGAMVPVEVPPATPPATPPTTTPPATPPAATPPAAPTPH